MFDIIAIGELLIDFTPAGISESGNPIFERNSGGAPANVAAAASRLGGRTAFIGKVGRDSFGFSLKADLEKMGVDSSGLVFSDTVNTTLAFVHLDKNGDRDFSFYRKPGADIMLEQTEIDVEMLRHTKVFHFGSVSMTDEPSRSSTIMSVRQAREAGALISYDPNLRPLLWNSMDTAKEIILSAMGYTDILKVSEEELHFLTDLEDMERASKELMEAYGIQLVLVTLGPKGAFYRTVSQSGSQYAYDVKTIDTTGAGDAFTGAFLYRLVSAVKSIDSISSDELSDMVDFACAAGSLATMRKGAFAAMPGLDDVEQCRKSVPLLVIE